MFNHNNEETIMKKTYIKPHTMAIAIKTHNVMVALSRGEDMSTGSADSRRGNSDWDDEE